MRSDPTILAFDTSAAHCAAALLSGDRVVAETCEGMARGQAERLMVLLKEVLAEAGLAWSDLDAMGVGTGPGNFTGLRIAVAAARGLALGLGVPAIGVTAFEARHAETGGDLIALPAPRDGLYLQAFRGDAPSGPALHAAAPGAVDRAALGLAMTAPLPEPAPPDPARIAQAIARRAAARLRAGDPIPRPAPLYVRPPDAAPVREAPPALIP